MREKYQKLLTIIKKGSIISIKLTENIIKERRIIIEKSIRKYRVYQKKKGITKKKIAQNANISSMACCRLLSGETKLSLEILYNFSNTLGITDINIFFDEKLTDSVISELSY